MNECICHTFILRRRFLPSLPQRSWKLQKVFVFLSRVLTSVSVTHSLWLYVLDIYLYLHI